MGGVGCDRGGGRREKEGERGEEGEGGGGGSEGDWGEGGGGLVLVFCTL